MRNYKNLGDSIQYTATADVSAGDLLIIGSLAGVAAVDIADGDTGTVSITGVYDLTKGDTATAYTQGEALYWDATTSKITNTATSNTKIGTCVVPAATAATIVTVKLNV